MNLTGQTLKKLSEAMNFSVPQCILVFDDIDLPIGKVRTRMNGSSGGHRGVASILEAFQTDQFRRVKIGVMPSSLSQSSASAVLNRFDETEAGKIRSSFLEVKKRLSDLVGRS
jgi:PTH1 family peptidyl-tRNA hydrolase